MVDGVMVYWGEEVMKTIGHPFFIIIKKSRELSKLYISDGRFFFVLMTFSRRGNMPSVRHRR